MTFSEGEKFKTALKLSSKFNIGCSLSPSYILHPFLLALHTNLAADVAKLGVSRAHTGGDTGGLTDCTSDGLEHKTPLR